MRMQEKVSWYVGLYMLGPLILSPLCFVSNRAFGAAGVLWFAAFAGAQFWMFRCPHCGKLAKHRHWGRRSLLVGDSCAYCQRDY